MSTSIERGNGLQVQRGKHIHPTNFGEMSVVLLLAPLSFRDIAGEQYYDCMKRRIGQLTYPVIRMIFAGGAQDFRPRSHALPELFRKRRQRRFVNTEYSKAIPGEGDCHPPGIR